MGEGSIAKATIKAASRLQEGQLYFCESTGKIYNLLVRKMAIESYVPPITLSGPRFA